MGLSAYVISFGVGELLHFSEKQQSQQGIGQSQQPLDMITLAILLEQKLTDARRTSHRSLTEWLHQPP